MNAAKLKEDLFDCLINSECRVLITELLDDYQSSFEIIGSIVQNFLVYQREKEKLKYEKRYLAHGLMQGENVKEVYQIVEEAKLEEWLIKLQNSKSSLYSVQSEDVPVVVTPSFQTIGVGDCFQAKSRQPTKSFAVNAEASVGELATKEEKHKNIHKQQTPQEEKISPKVELSSSERKADNENTSMHERMHNFFSSTSTTKKPDDAETKTDVTPKKIINFFKNKTKERNGIENIKTMENNSYVKSFGDNRKQEDVEEKLTVLNRYILSCELEMEYEKNFSKHAAKRRRVLDSDEEVENVPVHQGKLDAKEQVGLDETSLDEEGFVITKMLSQNATSSKQSVAKKTRSLTIKTSKETKKSSLSKETKAIAKTKQAGIMNFFAKK